MTLSPAVHALPLRDRITRFWAWWAAELKAAVPASLRQRLGDRAQAATWLRIAPNGMTLGVAERGRFVTRTLNPEVAPQSGGVPPRRGRLRLDPALVFETTLTLPQRAEANLRPIIGHHLGLIIPMEPAALAFDHVVIRRDPAAQTLHVAVAVTKRSTLDRACAAAWQAGFSPSEAVIDRAGDVDGRFDLLRHERRPQALKGRTWRLRALEVAILLLVLAAACVQWYRTDLDQARSASRIAQLRAEAAAVMQLQRQEQQQEEAVAVLQARRLMASPLTVIVELTRLLPDDTWITFLHAQDRNVELVGSSKHAASLIGLLEQSDGFEAPRFQSPVTTNPDGSEHFDLVVTVRRKAP